MTKYKTIAQQYDERKRTEFEMAIEKRFNALDYKPNQITKRTDNDNFKDAIHWQININNISFEYSEGIGHFLNTQHHLYNKMIMEPILADIKQGNPFKIPFDFNDKDRTIFKFDRINPKTKLATSPLLKDVIYSLHVDADAIDYDFNEWCDNFGYSQDSIKAKKIYDDCVDNYRKLRSLGFNLEELREYYQDY